MLYLTLFRVFFLIGLFGFGGGYAMLSLIQHEVVQNHHWMSSGEFADIVALSQMTPGPIGINSATYCGYTAIFNATGDTWQGIIGSLTASFALILPSFVLMLLISKMFMHYMKSEALKNIFLGLRPAVVGLLGAAMLMLMNEDNFFSPTKMPWHFWVSVFIFTATFVGVKFIHVNPIRMIVYAGFAGLLLLY
jgi:chromate transporter